LEEGDQGVHGPKTARNPIEEGKKPSIHCIKLLMLSSHYCKY
jgi:hypothetical protein